MGSLTYTVTDDEFDSGELADGSEVRSRFTEIASFLNGHNINADNLTLGATVPWTGIHTYTVASTSAHNQALVISSVLDASIYGHYLYTNAVQVNSPIRYTHSDNASSTANVDELVNDGTGTAKKITQTGVNASGKHAQHIYSNAAQVTSPLNHTELANSSSTVAAKYVTNAGTGDSYGATIRTLAGLNATMLAARASAAQTVTASVTTSETEITGLTVTLPANFLKVGTKIRSTVYGIITSSGTAPTAQFRLRYGGTAGTVLLDSGAAATANSLVSSMVKITIDLTCTSVGASGTISAAGILTWNSNTAPANRGLGTAGTGAGNASDITIDTTAQSDLVLTFQWGANTADNFIIFQQGDVELLK